MSIATEISRLQTAKADIKSAIEAKGVTVPSNATLDTYDTYVSQISGGGGTNYLEQYAAGTISGAITSTQLGTNLGRNMPSFLFYENTKITSVDLTGTGVTRIASHFCQFCSKLTTVIIPNTVTMIKSYFCDSSGITSLTIPSSVTTINDNFLSSSKITSLTVPNTVTNADNDWLYSCKYLTQLIFNAPKTELYSYCQECGALALVDLNSSVLGLYSCFTSPSVNTNLLEVVLRKTDGVVALDGAYGSSSFSNQHNVKLYVPSALIASYQADTNWAAGITAGYVTIVALEGSQYE